MGIVTDQSSQKHPVQLLRPCSNATLLLYSRDDAFFDSDALRAVEPQHQILKHRCVCVGKAEVVDEAVHYIIKACAVCEQVFFVCCISRARAIPSPSA